MQCHTLPWVAYRVTAAAVLLLSCSFSRLIVGERIFFCRSPPPAPPHVLLVRKVRNPNPDREKCAGTSCVLRDRRGPSSNPPPSLSITGCNKGEGIRRAWSDSKPHVFIIQCPSFLHPQSTTHQRPSIASVRPELRTPTVVGRQAILLFCAFLQLHAGDNISSSRKTDAARPWTPLFQHFLYYQYLPYTYHRGDVQYCHHAVLMLLAGSGKRTPSAGRALSMVPERPARPRRGQIIFPMTPTRPS